MIRNQYNYSIDYAILNVVFKCNGELSIRRIKHAIQGEKFLNRVIPEKTVRYHLSKLRKHDFLHLSKENWRRGQKLPVRLTPSTLEQMRFQTLVIQYDENKDSEDKNLNSYLKLKKKRQIQSIAEIEYKRRMIYLTIFSVLSIETRHYRYPGLSVKDIISAHIDGHPFHYLRLQEDISTVEECIKKLLDEKILIKIVVDSEGEPRYSLAEPIWKEFVRECTETFESVVTLRLHLIWQNIRKPTPEERLFLEYSRGQRATDLRMKKICENLESNRKRLGKKNLKDKIKDIESIDYNIVQLAKALRKKYHALIEKHTWICNEIIKTQYPEFIQRDVEKIEKNAKTKYKKYPILLISVTRDALEVSG